MATRMFDRRPGDRVAFIVARHGEVLTRIARSFSLCADDAQDAVQRSLEIYMRRAESLDPETELAWLKVVVKYEALAVRRARAGVTSEELDLDSVPAAGQRSVEERLESAERVERSAEVMRRLKRDEARALMLKAEGLSYVEIGERLGWTYTKVNRCITEGRRRFMKLYAELEAGAECERLAPVLVALAAGEASSESMLDLRPHLRNCAACRATVRELHASRLRKLTAWLPIGAIVAPARGLVERFRGPKAEPPEPVDLQPMDQAEKLDEAFRRLHTSEASVQSAAESASRFSGARLNLRGWLETALQRLQSSDVAMGIHLSSSGGGGRAGAIAALIGLCLSGGVAGTYCVTTVLLPDEKPVVRAEPERKAKRAKRQREQARLKQLPNPASRAAQPTPTPRPVRHTTPPARKTPQPNAQSHQRAPISPAQASTQDFSFEQQSADPAPVTPAAAPSTGGGEFEP